MRLRIMIVAFFSFVLFYASASEAAPTQKGKKALPLSRTRIRPCTSHIEQILKDSLFEQAFVGIKVISLKSGRVIYQQNADKLMRPASNAKLLTTSAALGLLGRGFQLKTEVYVDSNFQKTILIGPIFLKGYGDPLLKSADLDTLARKLYDYGIRTVLGDIVGDVSYFDDVYWGHGWMWDDDPGTNVPYLSALSVNANEITVAVTSGEKEGDPVLAEMLPTTSYVSLINQAHTSADTALTPLKVTRRWKDRDNTVLVEGAVKPRSATTLYTINVWKPELYTLTLYKEKLSAYGITVTGAIRLDTVRHAFRVASISHNLDSVAFLVNKESYNLGAENILKILAAERYHTPGSAQLGTSIMKEYLAGIGMDTTATIIADGSGVSRYNLVSPNALVKLLTYEFWYSPESELFIQSLPVSATDGTLEKRMTEGNAKGNVRAKTGTHSDASALSGYVTNARRGPLAFSILINHFGKDGESIRKLQDQIAEILVDCR